MHPFLIHPRWLLAYLGAFALLSVVPAAVLAPRDADGWLQASASTLVPMSAFAVVTLPTWYLCRLVPPGVGPWWRLPAVHGVAAAAGGGLWLLLGLGGARLAGLVPGWSDAPGRMLEHRVGMVAVGGVLYCLVAAFFYLLAGMQAVREAEARAAALAVRAREAALASLKAQVHPHFLFNSLNTVSALVGRDPALARQACVSLGDFLRLSLRTPGAGTIPLSEELALTRAYLGVEALRLGPRLVVDESVEPGCEAFPVPPLVVQPLVENAIKHGIAQLPEGGRLTVEARGGGGSLSIRVANPFDPEADRRPGAGLGLRTLRDRLRAAYGDAALLDVRARDGVFEVLVRVPREGEGRLS